MLWMLLGRRMRLTRDFELVPRSWRAEIYLPDATSRTRPTGSAYVPSGLLYSKLLPLDIAAWRAWRSPVLMLLGPAT